MLEAIRNLGILKMIDEFRKEFDFNALESVDAFLKQREKAIKSGVYAKLQFEKFDLKNIGVFVLENEKMTFKTMEVPDDHWKLIFRSTPGSQDACISPTWKVTKGNKELNAGDKKIKNTIEHFKRFIEEAEKNPKLKEDIKIFSNVLEVFKAQKISMESEGQITQQPFWDVFRNKKQSGKNKDGLNLFTIQINGKYPGEIPAIVKYSLNKIAERFYCPVSINFNPPTEEQTCSICNAEAELFPNVLAGVGINIANVDKPGFFPGVASENAGKAFPICAPCAEALYIAKFHVFSNLRQNISGHQALIIPHLVESEDKSEALEFVTSEYGRSRDDISGAERKEKGILRDLAENKGIATITFIIGDVGGQSVKNIRKVIPDVLPSRLSKISEKINEINTAHDAYPNIYVKSKAVRHPWQSKNQPPLTGNLDIIRKVLGPPKHLKQKSGKKRPPFKASSVNTLDLLSAIFLKREYPLKTLLAEFSSKLSYDFLGALSDDDKNKPIYSIRGNVANMVHLLLFLDKLGVIEMKSGKNFVSKYLEKHEGLKPLKDFLNEEARGLETEEKQYAFLVGLLFGKLVRIQQARQVSANALRWLKGLQLSPQDLQDIFMNTRKKLDAYSTPKTAWSGEMRGVAEAIGALGADIAKWDISRKEIPYYLCLGQSLSDYYLPRKGIDNETKKEEDGA
jgi:CRISPR-associated protein Csh1